MKCSRCAQENPPQDKFCPECGTRLRGDLVPVTAVPIARPRSRMTTWDARWPKLRNSRRLLPRPWRSSRHRRTPRVPSTGPFVVSTLR